MPKQHRVDGGIARGVPWSERGTLLACVRENPSLDTAVTFVVVLSWSVFGWGAMLLAQLTTCRSRISRCA
jgi:hypothetical protein